MDTILNKISRAGSSTERILAFSILLSMLAHGVFFPNEWLSLGILIFAYALWRQKGPSQGSVSPVTWTITDTYFIVMLGLTFWGLWQPVKVAEGLLGIIRWAILWYIYRWSREIALDSMSRLRLINWIQLTAVFLAGVGWFTRILNTWGESTAVLGRLSSWFGYSNSVAAFLGAALLLKPSRFSLRLFLGISLLSTGSRGAIGLYILISGLNYFVSRSFKQGNTFIQLKKNWGTFFTQKWLFLFWKRFFIISICLGLSVLLFKPAWLHLLEWSLADQSWGERVLYFQDGFKLAWAAYGLPRAGGWFAFPTVQEIPYWTSDPHSSLITILLNQGIWGLLGGVTWVMMFLKAKFFHASKSPGKNLYDLFNSLVFLVLHSLIDTDFSFGILGILFWLLVGLDGDLIPGGSFSNKKVNCKDEKRFKVVRRFGFFQDIKKWLQRVGPVTLSILLLSGNLCLAIRSDLLDRGKSWSLQAQILSLNNPTQSRILWQQSLVWDQTEVAWRRHLAELEMRQGLIGEGLEQVENVLSWQSFDLGAYEWAQSLVWETAEASSHGLEGNRSGELYRWVENIPGRIDLKLATISAKRLRLWLGSSEFHPSSHIMLLADYAHLRQLTK